MKKISIFVLLINPNPMKKLLLTPVLFLFLSTVFAQMNLHSFRVENIFGDSVNLSDYAGKKLMVVNTASFCGYTYQFAKLQKLDSLYQSYNFRVIGFPCNDFGAQDPFSDSVINSFCLNQYGITFPMMSKISIKTGDTAMVYKWLQKKSLNGVANAPVTWNFNKFLIDENGKWKRHLLSTVEPLDTAITNWITQGVTQVKINQTALDKMTVSYLGDGNIQMQFKTSLKQIPQIQAIALDGRGLTLDKVTFSETGCRFHLEQKGIILLRIRDGEAQTVKKLSVL